MPCSPQAAVNAATAAVLRRANAPGAGAHSQKDAGVSRTADCMHALCCWRDQRARALDEGTANPALLFSRYAHRSPTFGGVQELLEGNANPVLLFSRSCTQESYLLVHAGATGRREALWYGDSDCLTGQHGRVKGSGAASQVSSG